MEAQVTVRLPRTELERLDRLAARRGVRRSVLVREAIRAYLEGPVEGRAEERPFDRVRDLAGVVYGGPPDLGARHREYLKEILGGG
jgi:Arc/MetJ-type ribon-helix-helix transcriptional regulator